MTGNAVVGVGSVVTVSSDCGSTWVRLSPSRAGTHGLAEPSGSRCLRAQV